MLFKFSHISAIIVVVKLTCFRAGADVIIFRPFLPSFLISLEEELLAVTDSYNFFNFFFYLNITLLFCLCFLAEVI